MIRPGEPFHECRHTFASFLIAGGVNAKRLSTYSGHSSIQITLDRYGHLMPGNEDEAVALVDAYLERCDSLATILRRSDTDSGGFKRLKAESSPHKLAAVFGLTMRFSA